MPVARRLLSVVAAGALIAALVIGATAAGSGPDYRHYAEDGSGAYLGACREPARQGKAWRIRGLVDAKGDDSATGGLVVVTVGDRETGVEWLSGEVAAGDTATGSIVVRTSSQAMISGFVGTDTFTKAPAAIDAC